MSVYRFPLPALLQANFPVNAARFDAGRLFDDAIRAHPASATVAADAREDATGYTIELDVPGVAPESIDVLTEDGVLLVKGARANRVANEHEKTLIAERAQGEFERRFRLPKSADSASISATYAHGVLTLRVGKIAPAQPRRVPVNAQEFAPAR